MPISLELTLIAGVSGNLILRRKVVNRFFGLVDLCSYWAMGANSIRLYGHEDMSLSEVSRKSLYVLPITKNLS